MDELSQIVIGTMGALALWLFLQGNRWGTAIGLAAQPFWIYAALKHRLWGILLVSFLYAFVWAHAFFKAFNRRKETSNDEKT